MEQSTGGKRLREQPLNRRIYQNQRVHNIFSKQACEHLLRVPFTLSDINYTYSV